MRKGPFVKKGSRKKKKKKKNRKKDVENFHAWFRWGVLKPPRPPPPLIRHCSEFGHFLKMRKRSTFFDFAHFLKMWIRLYIETYPHFLMLAYFWKVWKHLYIGGSGWGLLIRE